MHQVTHLVLIRVESRVTTLNSYFFALSRTEERKRMRVGGEEGRRHSREKGEILLGQDSVRPCKLQEGLGKARSLCCAWWGRLGPKPGGRGDMVSAIRTRQKLPNHVGTGPDGAWATRSTS